jgi:hypothetical protein
MDMKSFQEGSKEFWDVYLKGKAEEIERVDQWLFPRLLTVGRAGPFFYAELAGAGVGFEPLRLKQRRPRDVRSLLGSFGNKETQTAIFVPGPENSSEIYFGGLTFASRDAVRLLNSRYPHLRLSPTISSPQDALIQLDHTVDRVVLDRTIILTQSDGIARIRSYLFLSLVQPNNDADDYFRYLSDTIRDPSLSNVALRWNSDSGLELAFATAADLASLVMQPDIPETQIGYFLRDHPDVLRLALGYVQVLHEFKLTWQAGTVPAGESLRPDLLLKRIDGRWDIGDLKLTLQGVARLVGGKGRRKVFRQDVSKGIRQLADYAEWFAQPANASYAAAKGIVVDQPKLLLFIGSSENITAAEIAAARPAAREFELVDYDTLINLYLLSAKALTA